MPDDTPPAIRSVITDDEFGGFRITIPGPGNEHGCGYGCGFMLWTAGLVLTLLYLVSDPQQNMAGGLRFLAIWAVLGLIYGSIAVVVCTSCEIVTIDQKTLVMRRENALFTRSYTFDLANLRNLRPQCVPRSSGLPNVVLFDHGGVGQTYQFGIGLSEHEILRLVKTIRSRFPIRDDWTDAEPLPINT